MGDLQVSDISFAPEHVVLHNVSSTLDELPATIAPPMFDVQGAEVQGDQHTQISQALASLRYYPQPLLPIAEEVMRLSGRFKVKGNFNLIAGSCIGIWVYLKVL